MTCLLSKELLLFALHQVSYKRWLPIYYEGYQALPKTFPAIYDSWRRLCCQTYKPKGKWGSNGPNIRKDIQQASKGSSNGLLVSHVENRLFANGPSLKMIKRNMRTFFLNNDDEHAAHHESSQSITKQKCVRSVID